MPAFLSAKAYISMTWVPVKYQDSIKMLRNSKKTKHKAQHSFKGRLEEVSHVAPTPLHTVPGEDPVHTHGVGCVLQRPSTSLPQPHLKHSQVPTHITGIPTGWDEWGQRVWKLFNRFIDSSWNRVRMKTDATPDFLRKLIQPNLPWEIS